MTEEKQKANEILSKISIAPKEFIEQQLAKLSFDELTLLIKFLDISLDKLADKVLAYKRSQLGGGHSSK